MGADVEDGDTTVDSVVRSGLEGAVEIWSSRVTEDCWGDLQGVKESES